MFRPEICTINLPKHSQLLKAVYQKHGKLVSLLNQDLFDYSESIDEVGIINNNDPHSPFHNIFVDDNVYFDRFWYHEQSAIANQNGNNILHASFLDHLKTKLMNLSPTPSSVYFDFSVSSTTEPAVKIVMHSEKSVDWSKLIGIPCEKVDDYIKRVYPRLSKGLTALDGKTSSELIQICSDSLWENNPGWVLEIPVSPVIYQTQFCVICLSEEPIYGLKECGHKCLCEDCLVGLESTGGVLFGDLFTRCPVCRKRGLTPQKLSN